MKIQSGTIFKHYKGGYVLVIATAKRSNKVDEVVFKGLSTGEIYALPINLFEQTVKNVYGQDVKRYKFATKQEVESLMTPEELGQIEVMGNYIDSLKKTKTQ